jgi:hypothetical protein
MGFQIHKLTRRTIVHDLPYRNVFPPEDDKRSGRFADKRGRHAEGIDVFNGDARHVWLLMLGHRA